MLPKKIDCNQSHHTFATFGHSDTGQDLMINRAKSNALKTQILRKQKDNLMAQAVEDYLAEKSNNTKNVPSLQRICQTFTITRENLYGSTGTTIH